MNTLLLLVLLRLRDEILLITDEIIKNFFCGLKILVGFFFFFFFSIFFFCFVLCLLDCLTLVVYEILVNQILINSDNYITRANNAPRVHGHKVRCGR